MPENLRIRSFGKSRERGGSASGDAGWSQTAITLKVHGTTLTNWERNRRTPSVRFLPRIIAYLGYCPWRPARSLGERLRQRRKALGFSRKRLARILNVDEGTLASWEGGQGRLAATSRRRLEAILARVEPGRIDRVPAG